MTGLAFGQAPPPSLPIAPAPPVATPVMVMPARPEGRVSLKVAPVAVLGPRLRTVTVYT